MKVKIKRLNSYATIPTYAKEGDAGLDLTSTETSFESKTNIFECKTGLSIEIPEGYVGLIFPRSSIYKTTLSLTNAVGVIDSGYRGEITFKFRDATKHIHELFKHYKSGERVGQLIIIPYPKIELEEVTELSDSERGTNGFGSTGT